MTDSQGSEHQEAFAAAHIGKAAATSQYTPWRHLMAALCHTDVMADPCWCPSVADLVAMESMH